MKISPNKFWGFVFVVGVFTLFILLYAYFSTSNDKTEASTVQDSLGDLIIVIDDKGFKPKIKKVVTGTSVKWVNKGLSVHRVTFGVNASLENLNFVDQDLRPAETLTFKFEKTGSFNYYDKNSGFTGTVEVK